MKSETNFLSKFAVENGVFGVFESPITLKSGKQSRVYINWRTVAEDLFLMDQLSDYLAEVLEEHGVTSVLGVAEGATKLGLLTQLKMAKKSSEYQKGSHTFSMIRGKAKEHGDPKDRFLLGTPKGKIALIEDVTTTGGSLLDAVKILKEVDGVEISHLFVLTNRDEKIKSIIEQEYGVSFIALSSARDLAEEYFDKNESSFKKLVMEELS